MRTPPRKPKGKPRGPWANKTPEERREYALYLRTKRKAADTGGRTTGKPGNLTKEQYEQKRAEQAPLVDKVMKKMARDGLLPEDKEAQEVLGEVLTIIRAEESTANKLAAARLFLDFTKAKPTSKQEITVKSAEDYLDEIADD